MTGGEGSNKQLTCNSWLQVLGRNKILFEIHTPNFWPLKRKVLSVEACIEMGNTMLCEVNQAQKTNSVCYFLYVEFKVMEFIKIESKQWLSRLGGLQTRKSWSGRRNIL